MKTEMKNGKWQMENETQLETTYSGLNHHRRH
jgi:hypothetical protein